MLAHGEFGAAISQRLTVLIPDGLLDGIHLFQRKSTARVTQKRSGNIVERQELPINGESLRASDNESQS
jgi:hypothetical protein